MKLNTEEWKEFRIGDWFEVLSSNKIYHAASLDIKEKQENNCYPYVVRSEQNRGIKGYINKPIEYLNPMNTLSFAQDTFCAFYRDKPYFTGNKVKILNPLFNHSKNKLLFLETAINKSVLMFSWGTGSTKEDIENINIVLPSKNNEPDWEFMEEYIKEIEEKYIEQVNKYNQENIQKALNAVGITEDELDKDLVIKLADRYEEFKVGDLFEISPTKHYGLTNANLYQINGKNAVIANTSQNNGIAGYTNYDNTERGNIITFSDTTDHNSIFYQPKDFVGYSHVQGLYPLNFSERWNKSTYLYFLTIFKKEAASKGFSYGYKFNRKLASKFKVVLPAIDKETPDFEYMEKAIYIYILRKSLNLGKWITKKKSTL